jgi:hypothetical protein
MVGKIRGFHCDDYEECRPLGCDAVWFLLELRFRRNFSVIQLLIAANAVPSLPILSTLMKQAVYVTESLVIARTTPHHISEDGILPNLFYVGMFSACVKPPV